MSTMLPFTLLDLIFATLTVGALLAVAAFVFVLAKLQQPAGRMAVVETQGEPEITAATLAAVPEPVPVAAAA